VIASRVGGLPEQVREGDDGWLVPPGDPAALAGAVARHLAGGWAERLEAGALRAGKRCSPQRTVEAILELAGTAGGGVIAGLDGSDRAA
jgi:glycosyltransferase involved in cell wall biosynthesis